MASETPKGCLEVVAGGVGQPTEPSAKNSQIPKQSESKIKLHGGAFSGWGNPKDDDKTSYNLGIALDCLSFRLSGITFKIESLGISIFYIILILSYRFINLYSW